MIDRTLGRYVIQEEIGHGVMGTVYRAFDPALDRKIALKTVRFSSSVPPIQREAFEKRFLAEARSAAALSHPNIVTVHDVGRDEATGTLFIAFEYLEGQTLSEKLSGEPIPWREGLRLVARLAEALHHAHARGIVHRDIKPANVMLLPSGEPKIMDFGIARLPYSELTSAGQLFGTPSYMSPEQAAGEIVDGRSDVFSLGAVLYLLLTGRSAFDAAALPDVLARIRHKEPPAPTSVVPDLPPALDDVVVRALAKDRGDRYEDAHELAEDIEDVIAERPPRHSRARRTTRTSEKTVVGAAAGRSLAAGSEEATQSVFKARTASRAPLSMRRIGLTASAIAFLMVASVVVYLFMGGRPANYVMPLVTRTEAARLEFRLEHDMRSGGVRVYVDDNIVLDQPLVGEVRKKVLIYKVRRGVLHQTIDLSPGEHKIQVNVKGAGVDLASSLQGSFEPGMTRRLDSRCSGLLKKRLDVYWGD